MEGDVYCIYLYLCSSEKHSLWRRCQVHTFHASFILPPLISNAHLGHILAATANIETLLSTWTKSALLLLKSYAYLRSLSQWNTA